MQDITVRQMKFEIPEQMDPVVVTGSPEESYAIVGLSLLLPYLEPYRIRTMKEAKKQVRDPDLLADLEKFCAQEGQHYRQHNRLNDAIRKRGEGWLGQLEAELGDDYRRFTRTKSLRFNLAYAEGFEALTTAVAHFTFERGPDPRVHPVVADLFTWHMIEELEHRTVAFDIYDHVCGGYLYRLAAGLYAQWHMARFITRVTNHLLDATRDVVEECGGEAGRRARARQQRAEARQKLLPKILRTYHPRYTPHDIEMTDDMRALAAGYSKLAVATSQ